MRLFDGGKSCADGVLGKLGDTVDAELFHRFASAGVDCFGTSLELEGDLSDRLSLGQELDQQTFLVVERPAVGTIVVQAATVVLGHDAAGLGTEVGLPARHGVNGVDEFVEGGFLGDHAQDAGLSRAGDNAAGHSCGHAQDACGTVPGNPPRGFDAIHLGHHDIEDGHIRLVALDEIESRLASGSLGDDFHILLFAEKRLEAGTDNTMIVNDNNSDRTTVQSHADLPFPLIRDPYPRTYRPVWPGLCMR